VPSFCRHNRFVERCPICSRALEDAGASGGRAGGRAPARVGRGAGGAAAKSRRAGSRGRGRDGEVRISRDERAVADGYSSSLVPGIRASADAIRLAGEIAFSSARVALLRTQPPGPYRKARELASSDPERASALCFLIAYISPSEGERPFDAIVAAADEFPERSPELEGLELGPRSSHEPRSGTRTLDAFRHASEQAGGAHGLFCGDEAWTAQRRFERIFERLALPGLRRTARFELLLLLGALGIYELEPDSLHLGAERGALVNDPTMLAAKRVFAIGDAITLERRSAALAAQAGVAIGVLDLALWNFLARQRATLGFGADLRDEDAHSRAREALGL
jgi:hypothetical protein